MSCLLPNYNDCTYSINQKNWRNHKKVKHAHVARAKIFKRCVKYLNFLRKVISCQLPQYNDFTRGQKSKYLEMLDK